MTPTLVLGTAQFGMPYPPLRAFDAAPTQPTESAVRHLLDVARAEGITALDTAAAYGDAEVVVGGWIAARHAAPHVHVVTKLRPNLFDRHFGSAEVLARVLEDVQGSLDRLRVRELAGYWLHSPRYVYRSDVIAALRTVWRIGVARRVGVSVYEPAEGEAAVEQGLDVCVPLNALDRRFAYVCRRAQDAGLKVYARSPFLQGLLTMDPIAVPARLAHAVDALVAFRAACERVGLEPARAALGFALAQPHVDAVVFGVDDIAQLRENVGVWREPPAVDWQQFARLLPASERAVVNPSLWAVPKEAA